MYADWLEERGDLRGEILRLELEFTYPIGKRKRRGLTRKMNKLRRNVDQFWGDLVLSIRSTRPSVSRELIYVEHGDASLEILGGRAESAFRVQGNPIAINWTDEGGSLVQFLAVTGAWNCDDIVDSTQMPAEDVVRGRLLCEQLKPLFTKLAVGLYEMVYTPTQAVKEAGSWAQVIRGDDLVDFPPQRHNLICTQSQASLNRGRVSDLRTQIQAGRRPAVLTLAAKQAVCEFIVAGHHELEAYLIEHVPPSILRIERCYDLPMSLEIGLEFLPPGHPGIAEYRSVKELQPIAHGAMYG